MSAPLYPFRLRDPMTGKWYKARWKATAEDIAGRGGEVIGPGEVRADYYGARGFHPFPLMTHAELVRATEPQPDMQPTIDACERFLALLFLRRYVTWCARARHQDRAEGAAGLWRSIADAGTHA